MHPMSRNLALGSGLGLIAVAVLAVTATTTSAMDQAPATADSPKLIAIKFHADWCGSCKAMGDVFTDLANKLDGAPVLFVEIDQTNRTTAAQAEYMVAALGAGQLWGEYGGKTGFILLIDADTKQVAGKLTKEHSVKDMAKAVKEALAAKG